jgi:exopolysaccharide production protein ExoZ
VKNTSKINSIQLLRAVAIMLVVYAHSIDAVIGKGLPSRQVGFYYLENWGAIGVDLFFVISGFIMTVVIPAYLHANGWKVFLLKRLTRILPLYYLISFYLVVRAVVSGYTPDPFNVLISFSILPVFNITRFSDPYIAVGWSLAYELYFYILIALLLAFARQKIYKHLLFIIPILSLVGLLTNANYILLKLATSPLLLEFGLGIAAGLIYTYIQKRNFDNSKVKAVSIAICMAGLLLMVATIFMYTSTLHSATHVIQNNRLAMYRSVIWGGPCFLLLLGVVLLEHTSHLKIPKLLVSIGNASYSCYLIHGWFVIPHVMTLILKTSMNNGDLAIIISVLASVSFSLLFYHVVEKNINRLASRVIT